MLITSTFVVVIIMLVQRQRDQRRHRGAIELQIRDDLFQNANDNHHLHTGVPRPSHPGPHHHRPHHHQRPTAADHDPLKPSSRVHHAV